MRASRPLLSTSALLLVIVGVTAIAEARPQPDSPGDLAPSASADPDLATYRAEVARGTIAFRDQRYPEARGAFTRAYAIHPEPVLLFNIASCWRRDGDAAEAVKAYRRFLEVAEAGDPRRALAHDTISTLEAELATPPPPPAPEPTPEVVDVDVAPPAEHGSSRLRPVGLGVAAIGVLGLVAGGVEAVRANSLEGDVESQRGRWDGRQHDLYRDGEISAQKALVLGVSGALITAAGVTIYYVGRRRDERAVRLIPTGGAGGAGFAVRGRF